MSVLDTLVHNSSVVLHPMVDDYYAAVTKEWPMFGAYRATAALSMSLPTMIVQSGERTFVVLCRMATWYKRQIKSKDATKADKRRYQDALDIVEFNINYMKRMRKLCDEFEQTVFNALWDGGEDLQTSMRWN